MKVIGYRMEYRMRPKLSFDYHFVVGWSEDLDKIKEVVRLLNEHFKHEYRRHFGVFVVRDIIENPLNEFEAKHLVGDAEVKPHTYDFI